MTKQILDYEVIYHGIENHQYFQGCGISFTDFNDMVTGNGHNPRDAYEDCMEGLAQKGYDVEKLEENRTNVPWTPEVPLEYEDSYYYLSIRVKSDE